jgi:FkbM family methyltransferase
LTRTLNQRLRPWVPNITLRIRHVEPGVALEVRLREHLGLVARGSSSYEPRYVQVLRSLIKPGDAVFDIGANIGFYSVLFSQWVGRAGKVIAFEPDPHNLSLLKRNLQINRCENTVVRDIALGVTQGEATFSRDTFTGSTGHLGGGPTYADSLFGNGRESVVNVKTNTLDGEVAVCGPPNLLKLDIEGGEYDVLRGGAELLDRHRPLVVSELSSWNENVPVNSTRASLATQFLHDHDYDLWDLDTGSRLFPGAVVWMILAVPRERAEENSIVEILANLKT